MPGHCSPGIRGLIAPPSGPESVEGESPFIRVRDGRRVNAPKMVHGYIDREFSEGHFGGVGGHASFYEALVDWPDLGVLGASVARVAAWRRRRACGTSASVSARPHSGQVLALAPCRLYLHPGQATM